VPPSSAARLPPVKGRITLDKVVFRYRPEAAPVLGGVSLDIRPGEIIGIVGRSGSGKSTLTKLVQRLYVPEQGRLMVDGIDISLIDAAQLRRQVGVVLQENLLFNRSVRENIAITDPAAPIDAVVRGAQLAGAHEFISELPEGYDTLVGEQGGSLSGGQRQRVAIARALFTNPRILILDEATSALDYESEAIIQRNMAHICKGRTVLIIAHRLSAVRHAHRIIVMEKGQIVEAAHPARHQFAVPGSHQRIILDCVCRCSRTLSAHSSRGARKCRARSSAPYPAAGCVTACALRSCLLHLFLRVACCRARCISVSGSRAHPCPSMAGLDKYVDEAIPQTNDKLATRFGGLRH
jgi:ABC-type methionine transport system ATPase subunit